MPFRSMVFLAAMATLGKVVRLNRDGSFPSDNPVFAQPGALPGLYSIGHRNPQGAALMPGRSYAVVITAAVRDGDGAVDEDCLPCVKVTPTGDDDDAVGATAVRWTGTPAFAASERSGDGDYALVLTPSAKRTKASAL